MWTCFFDMHSGGGQKLDYNKIYIEGDEATARVEFKRRFGRNPDNVTCSCCGEDYDVCEYPTLEEARRFEYKSDDVLIITKEEYESSVPSRTE